MKNVYKSFLVLVFAVFTSATAFSQLAVKTMSIGGETGITETGIVRVVVKITDKLTTKDVGVVVHEVEENFTWNYGMGLSLFEFIAGDPAMAQLRGYNESAWNIEQVKDFAIGSQVALWFTIDAVNNTYNIAYQGESETAVTTLVENFVSRSSVKGMPSEAAKFLTVVYNTNFGNIESIEVIDDAVVVQTIEPFQFGTSTKTSTQSVKSLQVYPTIADDYLNISSADEISSVKIYSLLGQVVFKGFNNKQISVSDLSSGTYIVEIKTVTNDVSKHKFIKR